MFNWLRKKLGYHVCEKFSQWERRTQVYERPVTYRDGNAYGAGDKTIRFSEFYQQRHCLECGRICQERLEH